MLSRIKVLSVFFFNPYCNTLIFICYPRLILINIYIFESLVLSLSFIEYKELSVVSVRHFFPRCFHLSDLRYKEVRQKLTFKQKGLEFGDLYFDIGMLYCYCEHLLLVKVHWFCLMGFSLGSFKYESGKKELGYCVL